VVGGIHSIQFENTMIDTNIVTLLGFYVRARPCTVHTRPFRLFNPRNGALRALHPLIAALLILPAKLMIYRENPAKNSSLGKNPRKCTISHIVHNATAGGTVNLNVSQIRLKQRTIPSHPLSTICPSAIPSPLFPSSSRPWSV
jgi:hypothetical protein